MKIEDIETKIAAARGSSDMSSGEPDDRIRGVMQGRAYLAGECEWLLAALLRERDRCARLIEAIETEIGQLTLYARASTHYDGCDKHHRQCAAIKRLRAAVDAAGDLKHE